MSEDDASSPQEHHRASVDNPDDLFNATKDPGASALGGAGTEAATDLPWFELLRHRVGVRAAKSPKYQWWVLRSLLAGLLALNFTFTVFNIVLLKVSNDFHTSTTVLGWTLTGPLLAFGLAAPIFGRASDVFGHRRLYLFGLMGAMVSAVLTSFAVNAPMLIAARTLDGIQGAATATASMALINKVFAKEDRVKALGWWSLIGAGGPVVGITVGAPVIVAVGWRGLFWVQLILLAIAYAVVSTIIPKSIDKKSEGAKEISWAGMDWIGNWSLMAAVLGTMLGLTMLEHHTVTSPLELTLFGIGLLGAVVFVYQLTHSPHPLIPKRYFTTRNFVFPMVIRSTANFAYFSGFVLFPILMSVVYQASTAQIGIYSIPRPIVFAIASPIAGYAAVKFGERSTTILGSLALFGSLAVFAFAAAGTPVWVLMVGLGLSGIGMGMAMPATSATMANEVEEHEYGVMSAAGLIATQVGEVAGITIVMAIQAAKQRALPAHPTQSQLVSTFTLPFIIAGAMAAIGVVASLFMRSMDRSKPAHLEEPSVEF